MTGTIVRHLILKDLYLLRWMSLGTIAAGLAAAAVMARSPVPINAGGVLMICALIVLNIFVVMTGIVTERKERVSVFVLSLPVSRRQYVTAKVTANAIAFTVPWAVLTVSVAATVIVSPIPDGFLPFWIALLGFLLFYYCALLGVALNTDATGWHAAAIIAGNLSVNFFIVLLFSLPSVHRFGGGAAPVWTTDILLLVAGEIVLGIVVLALAIHLHSRRPDFV
ncbi:MAG TPA: ABC-2 transporter permease [Vicinamibacterales bacterium]